MITVSFSQLYKKCRLIPRDGNAKVTTNQANKNSNIQAITPVSLLWPQLCFCGSFFWLDFEVSANWGFDINSESRIWSNDKVDLISQASQVCWSSSVILLDISVWLGLLLNSSLHSEGFNGCESVILLEVVSIGVSLETVGILKSIHELAAGSGLFCTSALSVAIFSSTFWAILLIFSKSSSFLNISGIVFDSTLFSTAWDCSFIFELLSTGWLSVNIWDTESPCSKFSFKFVVASELSTISELSTLLSILNWLSSCDTISGFNSSFTISQFIFWESHWVKSISHVSTSFVNVSVFSSLNKSVLFWIELSSLHVILVVDSSSLKKIFVSVVSSHSNDCIFSFSWGSLSCNFESVVSSSNVKVFSSVIWLSCFSSEDHISFTFSSLSATSSVVIGVSSGINKSSFSSTFSCTSSWEESVSVLTFSVSRFVVSVAASSVSSVLSKLISLSKDKTKSSSDPFQLSLLSVSSDTFSTSCIVSSISLTSSFTISSVSSSLRDSGDVSQFSSDSKMSLSLKSIFVSVFVSDEDSSTFHSSWESCILFSSGVFTVPISSQSQKSNTKSLSALFCTALSFCIVWFIQTWVEFSSGILFKITF